MSIEMTTDSLLEIKRLDALALLESQILIKKVIANNIVYRKKYSDNDNVVKKAKIIQKQVDRLLSGI